MDETEEPSQDVIESAVAETEDNTAAETVTTTSLINGEKDAQAIQNVTESTTSNENDNQPAGDDVESDTAVETTQREANDEPNEDSVNTSLTAEDEAHFRMLREAAESPPRETVESNLVPKTSESVLDQIAAIRAEGENTFTAASDFLQSIDLDSELASQTEGEAGDSNIENVVVDDAYIAALLRRAGATKVAASLEEGRISLVEEEEDESASLISGAKDTTSPSTPKSQSVSLPPLPDRKACPDKPFAVMFILHVILVYVLWGSIAMDSDSSKCQDRAPSDLALDKTVERLLAVQLTEDRSTKTPEECKSKDTCECFQRLAYVGSGRSLPHTHNTGNAADCKALCMQEEQCQYFVYSGVPEAEHHPKHCKLKAGPNKHKWVSKCSFMDRACAHKDQTVFGHKTCDLQPVPTCDGLVQLLGADCQGKAEPLSELCPQACGVCADPVSQSSVTSLWLALCLCSVLGFGFAYGFTGLYLNWKNVDRGKVLGVVQWLPGPFMIATGAVVMIEGDGWIGVFAGLLFFVVGCVDIPLGFNSRAAAAARAGEMTEATLGFLGGMWVAVLASAGACMYFVLWSYFFVSVLQWENNTVTFLYLLYLLFSAYWVSNVARALVLLTLGGTVAVAISTAGAESGRTHYSPQAKVLLLRGFFARASTRMLGAACRWGLDAGWASGLWAIVVGMRVMSRCCAFRLGGNDNRLSRCTNCFSHCAVPVIETSQRALLVHVILSGKSVATAGPETWALLCAGHENHNYPFSRKQVADQPGGGAKSVSVVPPSPASPGANAVSWLTSTGGRGVAHPAAWTTSSTPVGGKREASSAADASPRGTAVFDRLAVLDTGFSAYSPLLGPSVSGSFAAMLAILLTVLAGNDGFGVVWICLAGFVITASVISIAVSGVGAAIDAVQLCFIQEPETLARSYPVLFHRMTRLRSEA